MQNFWEVTDQVASLFLLQGGNAMVKINGTALNIAGKTLSDYLAGTSYDAKRIAVERNGDIVPKVQYSETILQDGDVVETVSYTHL